jgi:hypothetical protein
MIDYSEGIRSLRPYHPERARSRLKVLGALYPLSSEIPFTDEKAEAQGQ